MVAKYMNEVREFAHLKTGNGERQLKIPPVKAGPSASIRRVHRGTTRNNVARLGNVAHKSAKQNTGNGGNKAARLVDLVRESAEPQTGHGSANIAQLMKAAREDAKPKSPNAAARLLPTRFRRA